MKYNLRLCGLTIVWAMLAPAVLQSQLANQDDDNPYSTLMINALFDNNVVRELALVEEQVERLDRVKKVIQDRRKHLSQQLQSRKSEGAAEDELVKFQKELAADFETFKNTQQKKALEILLPHQVERLGQVTAQLVLRESAKKNHVGVLDAKMREYLGIDDEQAERLKKKTVEVRKRLAEQIKKLNQEATKEVMEELTPTQREKYKKLIGDPFRKREE